MTALATISKHQLPQYIEFPQVSKDGKPKPKSLANVATLLETLGIELRHNKFTGETEIEDKREGRYRALRDSDANTLWAVAGDKTLDTNFGDFVRLLQVESHRRSYHPVLDYLNGLSWDLNTRVPVWLTTYLGAEDTPLNRAIGVSALLGLVRRVLEPGCQHDHMTILEDPKQGEGKSSALRILGGSWFADEIQLGMDPKKTIEITRGVWVGEVGELKGQDKDIEAVKGWLSAREDRARLVWDRLTAVVPRQFVLFATTNETTYLRDSTGARRFYPFRVGKIDLDALARDRDQLFAEAYMWAKNEVERGNSNYNAIPRDLWDVAAVAQEARRELTAIEEQVQEKLPADAFGYIAKQAMREALGETAATKWTDKQNKALGTAMRKLGWDGRDKKQRPPGGGDAVAVFEKPGPDPAGNMPWLFLSNGRLALSAVSPTPPTGF